MKGTVQKQLLELLKSGEKYTMADFKRITGSSQSSISQTIIRLRKRGYDIVQVPMYYLANMDYSDEQTAEEKIMDYLKEYGSINREEGQTLLGIENVAAYIQNMIQNGVPIHKEFEYGKTADNKDRMLARYYLETETEETEEGFSEKCADEPPESEEKTEEVTKDDEIEYWKYKADSYKDILLRYRDILLSNQTKIIWWNRLKKQLQDNRDLACMLSDGADINRATYIICDWVIGVMNSYEREGAKNDAKTETEKQEV